MPKKNKGPLFFVSIVGKILVIGSFYFLIRSLLNLDFSKVHFELNIQSVISLILFTLVYLTFPFVGTFCWKLILEFVCRKPVPYTAIIPVFVKSNIAKYIPGSVFELVSRNFLGKKLGFKPSEIFVSMALESGLAFLLFACIAFTLLIFGWVRIPPNLVEMIYERYRPDVTKVSILVGLGLLAIIIGILYYFRNHVRRYFSIAFVKLIIKFFIVDGLMLLTNCFIFMGLYQLVLHVPVKTELIGTVIGLFLTSYFLGYLVPGASGGMGIRETLLVILLGPFFGNGPTLIAALLFRIISIIADGLAYLMGDLFEKTKSSAR